MIKTVIMTGSRIELPIDAGIEKEKISDRITEKNRITDWYGALYDSIAITADVENASAVLISDYTEWKQEVTTAWADYIELNPWGQLVLPWNREIQALNRPMVCWTNGDVLKIIAR